MRTRIIAGNWKMYKTIGETKQFIEGLIPLVKNAKPEVFLAVPFPSIHTAANAAKNTNVVIGGQNMHDAKEGAYTGETSALMLSDAGAQFVILGHSERRAIFHESSEFINRKVVRALTQGIRPILCIGETLQEKEAGNREKVLKKQLSESLAQIQSNQFSQIIIAYEPVWAIGTGLTATPEDAQQMHRYCRQLLSEGWGKDVADKTPILYGGSVKPENVKEMMEQSDIDGVLVGGASLSLESFVKIVNYNT